MKALIISGIYPPDIGGPATFTPRLAQYIHDQGTSVEVITLTNQVTQDSESRNWKVFRVIRGGSKLLRFMRTTKAIWKRISDADIVIANGLYEEVGLVLKIKNRPSIAKIVGDPVWERSRNRNRTSLDITKFNSKELKGIELLSRRLLVFSLNSFSSVTAPSKELCQIITGWGVKQIPIFIPNGATCKTEFTANKKSFDVVSVSRLVDWKNIDIVIEACAKLGATLAIVGDGPERNSLEALAQKVNASCQFFGNLDAMETAQILNASSIYISISEYEGLSFSLLEAMHAGMPMVISNRSGNRELFKEVSFVPLVDPSNLSQIAKELSGLLQNAQLRNETGSKLREIAQEKYCEEKQLKLFYESAGEK
jgi:glycosyltransferase involved in cell wall biosynthesis